MGNGIGNKPSQGLLVGVLVGRSPVGMMIRSVMVTNALTCNLAIPLLGSCPGDKPILVQKYEVDHCSIVCQRKRLETT